jgi:hypothetical protein
MIASADSSAVALGELAGGLWLIGAIAGLLWFCLLLRVFYFLGSALREIADFFRRRNGLRLLAMLNLEREKAGLPMLSKTEFENLQVNANPKIPLTQWQKWIGRFP